MTKNKITTNESERMTAFAIILSFIILIILPFGVGKLIEYIYYSVGLPAILFYLLGFVVCVGIVFIISGIYSIIKRKN